MTRICATCAHFTLKDSPQAAHGLGRCHGYDGHVEPVEPYVRWDAPFCVNYGKAPDIGKRMQWMKTQQDKDTK